MSVRTVPEPYLALDDEVLDSRIRAAKEALGSSTVILGHHYQRDDVIAHADVTGDSFKLARLGAMRTDATFIVFCGVHFLQREGDLRVGVSARAEDLLLSGRAPGKEYRSVARHSARVHGRLGSGEGIGGPHARGAGARPRHSLEGMLLGAHEIPAAPRGGAAPGRSRRADPGPPGGAL